MAYIAPSTRSAGALITAAIWNQDVVNNPIALYAGAMSIASQGANDVIYASSGTQLARSANIQFDGTNFIIGGYSRATTTFGSVTTNAGGAAIVATEFRGFANATHGACIAGFGTTNDYAIFNKSIVLVANVPTGTTNFNIVGALSKGSGAFLIDHPLDRLAQTIDLYHSFIEGPRYDLLYRGMAQVQSEATISIDEVARLTPGTFVALTRDPQVWAQHEAGEPVRAQVQDGIVHLMVRTPGCVSWLVIAERRDAFILASKLVDVTGRLVPEQPKPVGQSIRHRERLDTLKMP